MTDKIDLAIIYTPTGWEEIAIAEKFGMTLEEIEGALRERTADSMKRTAKGTSPRVAAARVAVFLDGKRNRGLSDDDAFKACMDLSVPDLAALLDTDAEPDPLEPSPVP